MSTTRILVTALLLSTWALGAEPQTPSIQHPASWPTFGDLIKLRQIEEFAVSADGDWVAYVVAPVFESAEPSQGARIAFLSLKDGHRRVLEVPDYPRRLKWSPRGDLSFLMETAGRAELWQWGPSDTENLTKPMKPIVTADAIGGRILAYAWSPGGDSIAYLAGEPAKGTRATGADTRREPLVLFQDTPGNFTGPTAPALERDSSGAYIAVTRPNGKASRVVRRQVVSSAGDPDIEWLRTGELSVIGAPVNASVDQLFFERTVSIVDPGSGSDHPLVIRGYSAPRLPAWSPSGKRLAYLHLARPAKDPHHPLIAYSLRALDRTSGAAKLLLSQEEDGLWYPLGPLWSTDERTIFIGRYERGSARLCAVDVNTGHWRALTPDSLSVSHYALANDGKHLLAVLESANQPRELYRLDPASGILTRLTGEGDALSHEPLSRVDAVDWPSADGRFTIHGFLLKPPDYDRKRRYPLIVMVHGGPGDFYTNSFMRVRFETRSPAPEMLASAGYLVLLPNPRGDSSYGEEFQVALNGDLAYGPFQDVDNGVSALLGRESVDSTAIGIYGMSYGAYLTAYAITQTRRYAAAVIDDGPTNLASLFAQQYALQTMSLRQRLGGSPWTRPQAYASQSPITFVDRVRTPVLMRYGGRSVSAADAVRFSLLAQGFEFYAGLKESNVPVEFVLHPDQGHGISDWRLYGDWVDRTLTWLRRWMPRPSSH